MDASNMLKPSLARGELHVIGATTLDEYRANVERDPALERRFQPVFVREPTVDETIEILHGLKDRTRPSTGSGSPTRRSSPRPSSGPTTSATASCPTRRSTSSTRRGARVRLRMKTKDDDTRSLEEELRRLARERDQATAAEDYDRAGETRDSWRRAAASWTRRRKSRSRLRSPRRTSPRSSPVRRGSPFRS